MEKHTRLKLTLKKPKPTNPIKYLSLWTLVNLSLYYITGIIRRDCGRGDHDARPVLLPLARVDRRHLPEAQGVYPCAPLHAL